MDQKIRFENTFRTIFLYPFALSFVITGLVWQWMLNPAFGLQKSVRDLGWESFSFDWIANRKMVVYTLVIAGVWQGTGLVMALMLAGLRGIDDEIWRASRVDGIPKWRTYFSIVIPMMRPVFVTALVIVAAGIVRTYDLVVAMTGGGPGLSSQFPTIYIYEFMFVANLSQGLAASTVLADNRGDHRRAVGLLRVRPEADAMTAVAMNGVVGREASGPRPKRRFAPATVMIYGVLIVAALYYLIPLYVMTVTSLKGLEEVRIGNIFAPPLEITFEPWIKAWTSACTGLYCEGLKVGFWKSVYITVPSVIVSIAVGSVNGYALANWRFKGSEFFFTVLLVGSFIPYQVFLFPLVLLTSKMGIYSTIYAVILVHTIFGMPILTLLFRNYFASLPIDLFKAARVDGAGFWGIFFRIMLPMSLPIFTVAIILQVTGIWNDYLFGLVFAGQPNYPMTVQLNNIVNSIQGVREYNVNMAATILTGLVPLTIYFVSGRLFVRGIAAGAVKG